MLCSSRGGGGHVRSLWADGLPAWDGHACHPAQTVAPSPPLPTAATPHRRHAPPPPFPTSLPQAAAGGDDDDAATAASGTSAANAAAASATSSEAASASAAAGGDGFSEYSHRIDGTPLDFSSRAARQEVRWQRDSSPRRPPRRCAPWRTPLGAAARSV